jgi:hypothetical protein
MRTPSPKITAGWLIGCLAVSWFSGSFVSGGDLFVAPNGSDRNPGSEEKPFATVQHGIERLHAGDTLYLRGGRYREQVVANNVRGEENAPICLRNSPGETAIIDGTEPIVALAEGPWIRQTSAVYSIQLKQDVWQLFLDERPAQPARFPNASLLNKRIWDMRTAMLKPSTVTSTSLVCPQLATSGQDFTGAVAMLAVGHWLTYARPVLAHGKGASEIRYESQLPGVGGQEVKLKPHRYVYLLGRACLDCENEWWFDPQTRTVSFWATGGKNPAEAADLMFLGGYRAEKHIVCFGESREAMKRQAELKDTNIFNPGRLIRGQTYYWRVDAVREGKTTAGPVWKFTAGKERENKV